MMAKILGWWTALSTVTSGHTESHCISIEHSKYSYVECPEKETTGVLANRHQTGQPRKIAVDDSFRQFLSAAFVRAVKPVTSPTTSTWWKVLDWQYQ